MIDINLSDMLAYDALDRASGASAQPTDTISYSALNRAFDASMRRKPVEKVLRPVHPNAGISAAYCRRLLAMLSEMNRALVRGLGETYRANPPAMAQDETTAASMARALREMSMRWLTKFDKLADKLSAWFAQSVQSRSDAVLKRILKDAGWTVEFRMTEAQRDVLSAVVHENVSLIKSIPRQHLQRVEGVVMRSIQSGLDAGAMTKELQASFGVSERKAEFISRDQTRKTTAMLSRARYAELGIDECEWIHSGGGKTPRKSHQKAGKERVRYDPKVGWFDPDVGRTIQPGELPNCRCVGRPVIKGFS